MIARYLNAEQLTASMPPSSLALTPANYKFRYMWERARELPPMCFI